MKNSERTARSTRKPTTRLGGEVTSGLQAFATEAELEAALQAKLERAGWRVTPAGAAYLEGYRAGRRGAA